MTQLSHSVMWIFERFDSKRGWSICAKQWRGLNLRDGGGDKQGLYCFLSTEAKYTVLQRFLVAEPLFYKKIQAALTEGIYYTYTLISTPKEESS